MNADPADLATAERLRMQFGIPADVAYRSQTCRRLATVRTRFGRLHTGSLVQDKTIDHGWVNDGRRTHYGRIVANHGTVWPDGEQHAEPDGIAGAPYVPPPTDWKYVA